MDYLSCVEVEPADQEACATVILLHGLGADGYDFSPIASQLKLGLAIRFVFPHAPHIPVTVNQKQIMPAWYDICSMNFKSVISDRDGLVTAAQWIADLIDRERERGVASERIIVAGFSQGGAVAYQTALTYPLPLAGLIAMSTYFSSDAKILTAMENWHQRGLPIQIYHGTEDPVVPEFLAAQAYALLQKNGYAAVNYMSYPMQHAVCDAQVLHIADWIKKVLQ